MKCGKFSYGFKNHLNKLPVEFEEFSHVWQIERGVHFYNKSHKGISKNLKGLLRISK